jgi:hypothetical protein
MSIELELHLEGPDANEKKIKGARLEFYANISSC